MMTMAFFDTDQACLVIDVFGHPLHYQVRFAADDLVAADDDTIRQAAEVWQRGQDSRTLTASDLALLQQAQQRLLAHVRRPAP
jgi:hypothetical protein